MNRRQFLKGSAAVIATGLLGKRAVNGDGRYTAAIPLVMGGNTEPTPSETPAGTVWINANWDIHFHRAGCGYLLGDARQIPCVQADAMGYVACPVCDAMCDGGEVAPYATATPHELLPTPTGGPDGLEWVFVTAGGTRYHRNGCRHLCSAPLWKGEGSPMELPRAMTCADAVRDGFAPCEACRPICGDDTPPPGPDATPTSVPDSVWCLFVVGLDGHYHTDACPLAIDGHKEDWEYIWGSPTPIPPCPVCRPECECGIAVPGF